MNNPLISIVIANFNYGLFLEDAIKSVISQGLGAKLELIICDAGSTDDSVEIIKKYANGLPPNTEFFSWQSACGINRVEGGDVPVITWWCSEKDEGQSAAFNKGFSHARGEWLTWLNADELYADGALNALVKLIKKKKKAQWITGNYVCFNDKDGRITSVSWGPHTSPSFLSNQHYPSAVFGSTSFWRREAYLKVGLIDEKLHYAMDTDYWARMVMAGYRQTRLNHFCWLFRTHNASKTVGIQSQKSLEVRRREKIYHTQKNSYHYQFSIANPWYVFWLFWRMLDGSILVRCFKKITLINRQISELTEVKR